MRIVRDVLLVALLVNSVACSQPRTDTAAVPNRGGHAYNPAQPAGQVSGTQSGSAARSQGLADSGRTTTVQSGEQLFHVAERERVDMWDLIVLNDLVDPVRPGQRLKVPQ